VVVFDDSYLGVEGPSVLTLNPSLKAREGGDLEKGEGHLEGSVFRIW